MKDVLPPPDQAFEWPREALRRKDYAETAKRWAVLRKAYPDYPTTWFHGAHAHMEAGELAEADRLLAHARQHFPDHPNSLTDSASLAIIRKEWSKAEDYLAAAREKHADYLQTWMVSADLALAQGELDKASECYETACRVAPQHPRPFVQLAEICMQKQRWEDALEKWEIVRERFPNNPAGFHRAAEAERQLGRPKEARQLILSQQYGSELFTDNHESIQTPRHSGRQSKLSRFAELTWTKAIFNLQSEVHRNYLSYGWWILEPLLHMLVFYIVFGVLLQRGGDDYTVFLLTGLIPWMWFMKAVSLSSGSIVGGQNLMLQVGLPSIVFPMVSLLQATLKQVPVYILLFGFVWTQGHAPGMHWMLLMPVILVQALFTIAFSCAVAALIPFARDLAYLVPTGLTFLMFLSGIFYDYRSISPEWHDLFLANPLAFLITCYRQIIIDSTSPNLTALFFWGIGSTITIALLLLLYSKLRYIFPRIVLE